MSAKYKSPSFLLPNELNTSANPLNTDGNPATGTGINSLYSMNFDASSTQEISLGTISEISSGSDFSISLWFKAQHTGGYDTMYGSGTTAANDIYIAIDESKNIEIGVRGQRLIHVATNIVNNIWYHFVLTVEGTTYKTYLNNGTPATGNTGTNTANSGDNAVLGDFSWTGNFHFNGQMDEVAIFNRALNTTEIAALYDGTGSNIRPSNLMATNLGPLAYYPLGEQAQNSGYPSATGNEWQFPNGVLQDYVMDFENSSNQYISGNASLPNSDYTISAWINLETVTTESIVTWGEDATGKRRSLFIWNGGGGAYRLYSSTYGSNIGGSTTLLTGQWYHAAVTVSSAGVANIYLNGSPDGTGTNTLNSFTGTNFYIGRTPSGEYFDGKISNVQIFNSVIPGTGTNSIETLYNNSSPLTDMSGFTSLTNWWKLNADSIYTPSVSKYPTALEFPGNAAASEINTGVISSLNNASAFTVSFWMLRTATHSTLNPFFFGNRDSSNSYKGIAFFMGRDAPSIRTHGFYVYSVSGGYAFYEFPANYFRELNTWHHIVLTWDSSRTPNMFVGYWNGGNAVSSNGTPPDTSITQTVSTGDFHIGTDWANTSHFGGQMSNFAIYDSALTADQVSTLFNFGTPEVNTSFSPTHNWKLDNLTTGLNDVGSLASNDGSDIAVVEVNSNVATIPSWKIPSALPITSAANYTTALDFDSASSDYIDCGTISILNDGDITFALWCNLTPSSGTYQYILSSTNSSTVSGIGIAINSSGLIHFTRAQDVANTQNDTGYVVSGLSYGNWHHLCGTYNATSGELKAYVDGVLKSTTNDSADARSASQALKIGGLSAITAFPANGKISNVSIFNTALSAPQVSTLYNGGTPETAISFSPVSWWKLDTGGSTITDYGSGGNTGTNNGASPITSDVLTTEPVNGVSTTLPSTALQQSDLQFDSPYSNYSLDFDGAGDYIQTGGFTIGNNYSFSCWLKSNTTTPSSMCFLSSPNYYSVGYDGNFVIRFTNATQIQMYSYNERSDSESSTVTIPSIDTNWHHFSLTSNGTTTNIYWDGSPLTVTGNQTKSLDNISQGLIIGDNITGNNNAFNGKIDETAVWNTALTEAQVLEIYNNGKPGDLDNFSGTAPISWWRLGENAYFNTGTTPGPEFTVPNSIAGAPNGIGSGTVTSMLSADAPGTYANGIGDGLAITDRVGDAPLSVANSQSYNMIPDDKIPYVPGYVGAQTNNVYSMTFDGVGDYFESTSINALQNTSNFSISFWVNFNSTSSPTAQQLVSQYSSNNGITIEINAGVFYFVIANGSVAYKTFNLSGNITAGTWYHICMNYDNGSLKGYLNGLEINLSGSVSTSVPANTNPFYIGKILTNNSLNASIDEVAIFDKALTADQIKFDLYEPTALLGGVEKTADIENNTNLPTPVAWYRMGD